MTFPIIQHIDELKAKVGHQPEIRFMTNEFGFTIVCYVVSTGETFTSENKEWARECRGITFAPDGKIASRPLHKFFNIGELPETQAAEVKGKKIARLMDKRDGSMVHPVMVEGKVLLKTKKSFTSDVALLATQLLYLPKNARILDFCERMISVGMTPIFEYTSPKSRIVLPYEQDELRLLHIRNNYNGEYVEKLKDSMNLLGYPDVPIVDEYDAESLDVDSLLKSLETEENKEGYILMFDDGNMVKGKTAWYLQLHRTIVFVRERDIAEMVVNETVDDYKSYLAISGKTLDKVIEIEHRVLEEIRKIEQQVDEAFSLIKHMTDRKEAALSIKGHPMFKAAMNLFNGKEYDVKDHFFKYVWKEKFSLEQV